MKMIFTAQDIYNLSGKFIAQISTSEPDAKITDFDNWSFWHEKRISFVSGLNMVAFYNGIRRNFESAQAFADHLNSPSEDRFYRLLTTQEIQFLCDKLKQNNY